MASPEIRCVLPARALNGESPVWDEKLQRLYWVDIREPALHAFDPHSGEDQRWELPAWIGCIGLGVQNNIAVALRTGLWAFDPDSGSLRQLAEAPFDPRRFIVNDGGCDPAGRFVAGPMYVPLPPETPGPKAAPLCRYKNGGWIPFSDPVSTSNGLAWSPGGRTMYHADTEQNTIWAFDYDLSSGMAFAQRVFARLDVQDGGPDGAAVDRDGFYWCAVFANGCLLRFDPAGKLERRIDLPVRYPTMPTFGDEGLDTIFVTSACWPLAPDQRGNTQEGNLFALPAPVPGLPARRWRG